MVGWNGIVAAVEVDAVQMKLVAQFKVIVYDDTLQPSLVYSLKQLSALVYLRVGLAKMQQVDTLSNRRLMAEASSVKKWGRVMAMVFIS